MKNKIVVYSMNDCVYCDSLKTLLNKESIEFVNFDVEDKNNEIEYKKIREMANSDSVPIVRIGNQLLVPEKSFQSIPEAVEITKMLIKIKNIQSSSFKT